MRFNHITYLNHGSFGACPNDILQKQQELIRRLEGQPVRFFIEELEPLQAQTRKALAGLMNADWQDIVPVRNATEGVNAVLRSLHFKKDDEILITDHGYNACSNAVRFVAERAGCNVSVAKLPFPLHDADELKRAILLQVTKKTRLVLIDHITSATAIVLPVKEIVEKLNRLGIESLVDGAHAPGQIPVNLADINPTYYTGNCHKWLCTPKGAAFLYVRRDRQPEIRPLVISHGANSRRQDLSRFQIEFLWQGTHDPTAFLCVPAAIAFLEKLYPGGLDELMRQNHSKVLQGQKLLCESLDLEAPVPAELHAAMASVILPEKFCKPSDSTSEKSWLNTLLWNDYKIECMVSYFAPLEKCVLRLSAQYYNEIDDYRRLVEALKKISLA